MGKQAIVGATRGQHFFVDPSRVTIIGRDTAHKAGEHPLFDERATRDYDEARVRNIRTYGVKVAVVVRKNGKRDDGEDVLEVIDGRGRTIDCREAFRRAEAAGEVGPMLKVEFERSDEDTQVGVMVSLNEHRVEDTPMNRARKAGRILSAGRSVGDVANMFAVSEQAVRGWQVLLELSKAVQKAVDAGSIAASAALQLRKLSHEEQNEKLGELLAGAKQNGNKRPTARQARDKVNGHKAPRLTRGVAKKLQKHPWSQEHLSADARALLSWIAGDDKAIDSVEGLRERLEAL
jgi:hypothetical protein